MNKPMKRKSLFPDFRWIDDIWDDAGRLFTPAMPELTTPAVNVVETPEAFTMEFGVPGMDKQDFDLKIENGCLMLSAEKRTESEEEDENFKRREFNFTSFKRSFWLPENVRAEEIKATYDNGILKVWLPKKVVGDKPLQSKIEVN